MRYALLAVLFVPFLVGCPRLQTTQTNPQGAPVQTSAPLVLTEDQKVAWIKYRRDQPAGYQVAALGNSGKWETPNRQIAPVWVSPSGPWSFVTFGDDTENRLQEIRSQEEIIRAGPGRIYLQEQVDVVAKDLAEGRKRLALAQADVLAGTPGLTLARESATRGAREPQVKCVAVLDLYSQPLPRVVEWWADQGRGVKKLGGPPDADSQAAAESLLLQIQIASAGP